MAAAFDVDQLTPQGMIRREGFSSYQAGPFARIVAACDLWRQREEQLVQTFLGEEVAHQTRSAFRQDHITTTHLSHSLKN